MSDTLFDLDAYTVESKPRRSAQQTYVLYYKYEGKLYLGRRLIRNFSDSHYEWLIEGEETRKLPTRYKRHGDAQRYANKLNRHRTEAGLQAGITVRVKLWTPN